MKRKKITVNGRVSAAIARFDHREMHDVFIVIILVVYFLYGVYIMGATW